MPYLGVLALGLSLLRASQNQSGQQGQGEEDYNRSSKYCAQLSLSKCFYVGVTMLIIGVASSEIDAVAFSSRLIDFFRKV